MPPSLDVIRMDVEPASKQFSISSLRAEAGLWMILREYVSVEPYSGNDENMPLRQRSY